MAMDLTKYNLRSWETTLDELQIICYWGPLRTTAAHVPPRPSLFRGRQVFPRIIIQQKKGMRIGCQDLTSCYRVNFSQLKPHLHSYAHIETKGWDVIHAQSIAKHLADFAECNPAQFATMWFNTASSGQRETAEQPQISCTLFQVTSLQKRCRLQQHVWRHRVSTLCH